MEFESIIVAIITGLCAVLGQWLIARDNKRKADTEQAVRDARTAMRLDQIESKLDEHNGYRDMMTEFAVELAEMSAESRKAGDAIAAESHREQIRSMLSSSSAASAFSDWLIWNLERTGFSSSRAASFAAAEEDFDDED